MARNGYRAVRTHADVTADNGLTSVEALSQVRQRVADVIDVADRGAHRLAGRRDRRAEHRALLTAALDVGADLVGGCPHLEHARGRLGAGRHAAATEALLSIAAEPAAASTCTPTRPWTPTPTACRSSPRWWPAPDSTTR